MAEAEVGPVAQADGSGEQDLPDLLRGHTICLITTDAEGRLNIKIDLPAQARVNLVGDIVAFSWLVGRLNGFLGSVQEATCRGVLEKRGMLEKEC